MTKRAAGEGHVRRRGDGRWEARVPDAGSRTGYRSVYGKTQREVLAKAREARRAPVTSREPLADVLERWLMMQVLRRRRPLTYETYRTLTRRRIVPYLGAVPVGDLTPQRVDDWLRDLEADGLKPASVRTTRSCLVSCLTWAVRQRIVTENVARLVEGVSVPRKDYAPLTAAETRRLVAALAQGRYAGPLLSCLYLGARIGEACGLTWADVDLGCGVVALRRQLQPQRGKGLVLTDLKTAGSRRTLAVPGPLLALMAQREFAEPVERQRAGIRWQGQYDEWGLVWRTPWGSPCHPHQVQAAFGRIAASLGRPDLTPHALRHQHASLLFDAGVPLKQVSAQLGHSTQAMTADVYVHLLPQAAQRVAATVEAWLDEPNP